MTAASVLSVESVTKVFSGAGKPDLVALEDVSFSVGDGEFVAIVGASGSGKSTLLRIIDGLLPATSGAVRVGGEAVTHPGFDRAMVFQQDCLLPWKTVLDNVAYGLVIGGAKIADAHETARRFVQMAGLTGFEHHYPHQLSGGMRQRVNVARALAVNPRILLLDEPFAALDAQTREIMQGELLNIWSESRTTVVLITHQIEEAVFLSDRVVVFSARPGSVREEIPVPLPRPRTMEMKRSEVFVSLVDRVWRLIEHEVRKAVEEGMA
ncbi:ABC transporter ATP-binding protein [Oleispirillum naphthae]|uniref:ABC transporter ATP-binding protein n=1 Tax=Oleispirillum naphthae TaxID=2838853 RepID=UPI0030823F8D